jgi:tRNA modification GTPase
MRSLQGEFSAMVQGLVEAVTDLRAFVEAAIDFPGGRDRLPRRPGARGAARDVRGHFDAVEKSARQGRVLRDGMTVVIAGRPNAGKSSLLNRLAGYDAAIVTPVAGTTRDVVRERHRHRRHAAARARHRGPARRAADAVEVEGMRRARSRWRAPIACCS